MQIIRTMREILAKVNPDEISDILLQLHLRTLFEHAKPDDTVSDIKARVSKWTERIISDILIASPQKEGYPSCFSQSLRRQTLRFGLVTVK